eukprot:GEMP01017435.1.p1 GENE.GEMP01017435.1~~GEMP01017435.1.p1  ORF type:complete len:655 (+),score=161.50 GEMP01017435.1:213-2177(+)
MKQQLRHVLRNPCAESLAVLPWHFGLRVAQRKKNVVLANHVLRVMPVEDALHALQQKSLRWTKVSFNTVLSRLHSWQVGLRLLDLMRARDVYTDATTYTAMLTQLARTAAPTEWPRALNMLRTADKHRKASLHTFNAAISATRAHWPAALEILHTMQRRELVPDAVTSNALLQAAPSAEWAELHVPRLEGDSRTDAGWIHTFANQGRWEDAISMLQKRGKSEWAYGAALKACARGNAWHAAIELLHQMKSDHIEPNAVCYNTVIAACDRSHRPKEAFNVLASMPKELVNRTSINAMINATKRDWEVALVLFQQLAEPDTVSYNTLFNVLGFKGMWQRALEMLKDVPHPDVNTYNILMQHAVTDDRPVMPVRRMLYKQMLEKDVAPSAASLVYAKREKAEVTEYADALIQRSELDSEALNELVILLERLETLKGAEEHCAKVTTHVASRVVASLEKTHLKTQRVAPDTVLEAVPALGRCAMEVVRLLGLSPEDPSWVKRARNELATHLRKQGNQLPSKPQADAIYSWMQYDFDTKSNRGNVVAPGHHRALKHDILPVYSLHRREDHSERRCLAIAHALTPERGVLQIYSSHTPCISCLACYWQFKKMYPNVTLEVAFDPYEATLENVKVSQRKQSQRQNERSRNWGRAAAESGGS